MMMITFIGAILCSRADSLHSFRVWFWMSDYRLLWRFFQHPSKWCTYSAIWLLHGWCHVKLLPPRRTFSIHHRLPPCTILQCHFMQSHIRRVHVSSAVTCHLHFWQNDREYFHSIAVTQGWNGYRNKSQHRMLTLNKKILPPLCQDSNQQRVMRSTSELCLQLSYPLTWALLW